MVFVSEVTKLPVTSQLLVQRGYVARVDNFVPKTLAFLVTEHSTLRRKDHKILASFQLCARV